MNQCREVLSVSIVMEENRIFTLAEVKAEGKEIAFIKGNRDLAKNNVNSKVKSLSECGMNLVPIMVVEGKKAVDDGCSLVSPDGKDIDNDAEKYLVIVDGQHRYSAALKLMKEEKDEKNITDDSIRFFLDYSDRNTKELLAVTNIESYKWKAGDFAKGAVLYKPDDKVAKFANEYLEKGISISTISIYLFGQSGVLTANVLGKLMKKENVRYKKDLHLDIAEEALPLLIDKVGAKFAGTRYCANGLYSVLTTIGMINYKKVIEAIKNLTDGDVKEITSADKEDKQTKFGTLLNARMPDEK